MIKTTQKKDKSFAADNKVIKIKFRAGVELAERLSINKEYIYRIEWKAND